MSYFVVVFRVCVCVCVCVWDREGGRGNEDGHCSISGCIYEHQ